MSCSLCAKLQVEIHYVDSQGRAYFKCTNCKLIFLDSKWHLTQKEEKLRYDLHQNNSSDIKYVAFLNKLIIPLVERISPLSSGLDYGCGPGPTVSTILKNQVLSICDYDPIYYPNEALLKSQYDFITCTEVVEHFYNPKESFIELNALLKDKGSYLAIMTEVFSEDMDFKTWWYRNDDTHVSFYSKDTFLWIANWLDLKVEFPEKNVVIYQN